eukprot:Skav215111  [mRNA]  locus=scaffold1893:145229:145757:+ [translate_table: standard]
MAQVDQVVQQLARSVGDPWRAYTLIYGSQPLKGHESLGDVLGCENSATLVAVKQPLLRRLTKAGEIG